LKAALDRIETAETKLMSEFEQTFDVNVEPLPNIDAALASWRERFGQIGGELPLDPGDAVEAHRREAWRVPPAREGKDGGIGARDAAIWLTVVRDHCARDEEGHFLTRNTKDFPSDDRQWRGQLAEDLEQAKHPLRPYESIEDFLRILGNARTVEVSLEELGRRAAPSLQSALAASWDVPRAIYRSVDVRFRYKTEVKEATPVAVREARHFEEGAEGALTVVDSEWNLVVDCLVKLAGSDPTLWSGVQNARLTATVQLYLPGEDRPDLPAQIINARLRSAVTAFVQEDGGVLVIRPA
jgi:hypothetical protein